MTQLTIGKKAPALKGVDQNGNPISLNDFKGKKVVLYFYPKDNTPGCTAQACNLRDHYTELLQKGYAVIGISPDDAKSHKKFEEKFDLPFPLIADTDHSIAEKYGVWGLKKFMGREYMGIQRTTFLINESGNIAGIIDKPDTKNHTAQILEAWQQL
ncbi:thioredoxin-dependent thiol peroxidase [Hydrotalea sp.]|uniref:thioredoxin-dependent thiol peroxidase n=1 Tax=Hydrotalea sp. TaxID=2881279 RepID=UPI002589C382|nr:thioredoxin-dependent thiol peroxidase [Hydrotalea sp.]